jgi:hypothetical protein
MPDLNNVVQVGEAASHIGSIIADSNQTSRLQEIDKLAKQFFTCASFKRIVRAIGKRIVRFMRMQWENVP